MLKLREYQHQIVDFILQNKRCNLFVPMGMGKTVSVLTAIDLLKLFESPFPVLVIGPLRVIISTWSDEIEKWPHLSHLRVSVVTGTPAQRKAAVQKDADIYCINYENLPWLDKEVGSNWPFKTVVADECSKLKGFRLGKGTKRAKALAKHIHKSVDRYIGMTGTPSANGIIDTWAITWMVDAGERLGRTFGAFTDRWFRTERVGADPHAVRLIPLEFSQTEIEDRIRDISLSFDPTEWFNLDEPIVNTIKVDLPPKAKSLYQEMETDMFVSLQSGEVEAFNAAGRTLKCLQIASGALYTEEDSDEFEVIHDEKIEALKSVVEEANGMPVMVAYHFKSDLVRLKKAFPSGRHLDKDPQTIRDWNEGKIPLLFCHPQSAGHGLSLQHGGNIIAFFSHWWNLEEFQQIIERIGPTRQAQSGYNRPVYIYHIIARNTVDELVMARRESKREVQDLLLEAMKLRSTK